MAKQSGLGDNLYVAGFDLSGDVGSLGRIAGGNAPIDVTAINKLGRERIGGLRDGGIDFNVYFNDAAGQAHPKLSALPTTDQILTYCRGTLLGLPAAAMVAKQVSYDGKREDGGAFTFDVSALANASGLEWGRQLTAGKRVDAAVTATAPVDFGANAPGFFDAQAYLHVFGFTGADATIKIQTSTDNAADPYTDRIAFDQVTSGPQAQRKTQSLPGTELMERFVRANITTVGGFSSLTWALMVIVNQAVAV